MTAESNASFEIDTPLVFTAGTVGEPGHRVFYVQAQGDGQVVTLKLEKQQVGALAEYLSGLLADLPTINEAHVPTLLDLVGPVVPEWTVGTLAVAWDELNDRMVLVAEELLTEEEVEAAAAPATARFRVTREQVAGFVERARVLVAGGRPPCPLCGGPLDPEGHACPRLN
ncbi:MAG: hypothetical protein QOG52_1406 [Frankiaceae bacterium]|jgi:uncharacterized repeat protein (TIGR03847 family)|nr:hypothetical protein [Frankiaceae bacterium]